MSTATLSRWARRFLLVGVGSLVLAQVAALADLPRTTEVALGLYGFVLTVAFGKAYSLVPSYFDRTLVEPRAPAVHLPFQVVGVGCLAAAPLSTVPPVVGTVGAVAWVVGVAVFVGAVGRTIAGDPLGRRTGTSEANEERAPLDRLANPFMPVAVAYLLVGTYDALAARTDLPAILGGPTPRTTHLLAAGFALLLLFAVGYRLLPRFLVGTVPRALALVVLPAGALGPALIAVGYSAGPAFHAGAALEAVAVAGFAVSYGWLFATTDRDRVGFYGPLLGLVAGLAGVVLGLYFAIEGYTAGPVRAHLRLNVFGLLGLSIVGVLYQFYPPAVSGWPGDGDRLALASIGLLAVGVGLSAVGPVLSPVVGAAGQVIGVAAGLLVAYLLAGVIRTRTGR